MKIGKYELFAVDTGTFKLDGGAMFGVVPKILWELTNPSDRGNRITLAGRNLLLKMDNRIILIDTGIGEGWDEKFKSIYGIDQTETKLMRSLANLNLNPEDITDVVLTHLHFDHTGGSVLFKDGKPEPAFPNAGYYIQKKQFEWASDPSDRDKVSFVKNRFLPLMEEGVLNLIDHSFKLDDEIDFIVTNGHTFDHQMIKISDSSNTLLYCADLIPTSSHVHLPYIMGFDLQPLVTLMEKKEILAKAVDEDWMLFFEHDPLTVTCKIERHPKGFKAVDKSTSLK